MRSEDNKSSPPRAGMHEAAHPPPRDVPSPPANPNQPKPPDASGAQYRLRTDHVDEGGRVIPAGTVVGDGTPYPWEADPSNSMEGVNGAGIKKVNELHQRLYGKDAPWHDPKIQKSAEEDLKKQEEQRKEEEGAEPVSHAQAVERDKEWKGPPDPIVQARLTGAPVPGAQPITGATAGGPGVATPRVDQEQPRPTRPLEEQLPKSE